MSVENKDWHVANHVKKAKDMRREFRERAEKREDYKEIFAHKHR